MLPLRLAECDCYSAVFNDVSVQDEGLSTMQTFDMTCSQPLPPKLLPYLRLAFNNTPAGGSGEGLLSGLHHPTCQVCVSTSPA